MRSSGSADPWSSFLAPPGGPPGSTRASTGFTGPAHSRPDGGGERELSADSREVLRYLADGAPVPVEEVGEQAGLGLLEVAEAVRRLAARGLVRVRVVDGRQCVQAIDAAARETDG